MRIERWWIMLAWFSWLLTLLGCAPAIPGVKQQGSALRFTMKSIQGEQVDLARYQGQVVLVVNVASKCGYTGQYEALQRLHEKYQPQGLAILGFPCNQFFGQEPGTSEEIASFCRLNYGVTFDLFAKVDVNGDNACELYKLLTSLETRPLGAGPVGWNFEKFLLDRRGYVVGRYATSTPPDDPNLLAALERALAQAPQPAGEQGEPRRP